MKENITIEELKVKAKEILSRIDMSNDNQQTSGDLLEFMLQDLLDYSQIKNGKFCKNISIFNLRSAVEIIIAL